LILEEATLSYNRSIQYPKPLSGFKVNNIGQSPIPEAQSLENANAEYKRGKEDATVFYQAEITKLRKDYAEVQSQLLSNIDNKVNEVISKLDRRLPDLVIGLAERVLGQITLNRESIEQIVKSMVAEFSEDDEKLDVYLCPQDLSLLKAFANPEETVSETAEENQEEEGFASAIAGIFDGLDGDDALLEGYPNVKFFEDSTLQSGDCQIKSRFGLLDGRVSTKLRKIEEELKRND
jgi:flagellar biosynthesis/type III secretory pathway protein FliH